MSVDARARMPVGLRRAFALSVVFFVVCALVAACLPDPSGETLDADVAEAAARGFSPIFRDRFEQDIAYGGFPAQAPNWWAYCGGPNAWHDTSHNGVYRPESVVSEGNGVLDVYLHTVNGEHQVAAPVPVATGETYNTFGTPGCVGSGSAWNGQLYGRWSARFRADALDGYKTAWLLWPDSDNPADGEIDWMESRTGLNDVICAFFHRTAASGGGVDNYCTTKTYTQWHTATVEWSAGAVDFYLDKTLIGHSTVGVPQVKMHAVLQTETETDGTVPADATEGHLMIDWMAVYAPNGGTTTTTVPLTTTTQATTTTTTGQGDVTVAAAGDIACTGVCGQDDTAGLIEDLNPDAVLMLGDAQYETGTASAFNSYYDPWWGQFKPKTWITYGGSHDCYGSAAGSCGAGGFLDYYNTTTNGHGPTPHVNVTGNGSAYSFDLGAWHFISLDTYCFESHSENPCSSSAVTTWLTNDLTSHTNACTAIFMHEPFWTSPTTVHGRDTSTLTWMKLAYDHGVDVLLQAHNHDYERFYPQNPYTDARDDTNGISAFVVGTGGRSFYSFTGTAANSATRQNTEYGVLSMTLHASSMGFSYFTTGTYSDSGTVACH